MNENERILIDEIEEIVNDAEAGEEIELELNELRALIRLARVGLEYETPMDMSHYLFIMEWSRGRPFGLIDPV